jgi:hypothetical protein
VELLSSLSTTMLEDAALVAYGWAYVSGTLHQLVVLRDS